MKKIHITIPEPESIMLKHLQKTNLKQKTLEEAVLELIRREYLKRYR